MNHLGRTIATVACCSLLTATPAWAGPGDDYEPEPDDPSYFDSSVEPQYAIDCQEHEDVGYVQGDPFTITVVTVDGKPVEVETANAYYAMQQAAAADGVGIKINSGFRTMAEQEYLYNCYINCNCNNCNLAAKPGYSNHQSGHALDLNTAAQGVYGWLQAHGGEFGFEETVNGEPWHWEWWGGGPPTNGPCGTPDYRAEYVGQSFPLASQPPVLLIVGECIDAWIDLRNTGDAAWTGETRLSPTPRDVPSLLHDPSTWLSPTRIASAGDVPPGGVGHFAFRLCPQVAGETFQTFGVVQEGVTWFSDGPLGGGPPDDQLEVRVLAVNPVPPYMPPKPLPPPPGGTTGTTGDPTTGDDSESGGAGGTGGGTSGAEEPETSTAGASTTNASGPGSLTGGATGGLESDDGCGCRGAGRPGAPLLLALALLGRRRRRVP